MDMSSILGIGAMAGGSALNSYNQNKGNKAANQAAFANAQAQQPFQQAATTAVNDATAQYANEGDIRARKVAELMAQMNQNVNTGSLASYTGAASPSSESMALQNSLQRRNAEVGARNASRNQQSANLQGYQGGFNELQRNLQNSSRILDYNAQAARGQAALLPIQQAQAYQNAQSPWGDLLQLGGNIALMGF